MKIPQYFFLIPPRSAGIKRFEKKSIINWDLKTKRKRRLWFVILDYASQIEGMTMS